MLINLKNIRGVKSCWSSPIEVPCSSLSRALEYDRAAGGAQLGKTSLCIGGRKVVANTSWLEVRKIPLYNRMNPYCWVIATSHEAKGLFTITNVGLL